MGNRGAFFVMLKIRTLNGKEEYMAKPKYKKKYADDLLTYFFRFIEMRDDPDAADKAERQGYLLMEASPVDDVYRTIPPKPSSGYPTLTKFAIKIGVTPRTITNWRKKYKEFDEACEFADAVQDDVLNERALTGKVDGKVAMKIRELKTAAKKDGIEEAGGVGGRRYSIDVVKHIPKDKQLELKEWDGEVKEDEGYKPQAD